MRRTLLALALLLVTASPARAGLGAWLRASALPRLGAGVEWGTALPVDPYDFGAGWKDSRGYGAFATCALTPVAEVVARVERDRYPLTEEGLRRAWPSVGSIAGGDATIEALSLGLRLRHERGALRAHATLYGGVGRLIGRRVTVTYPDQGYSIAWGEVDATVRLVGFGVGATWKLPHLPDPTVEARALWYPGSPESVVPLRVGVTLP